MIIIIDSSAKRLTPFMPNKKGSAFIAEVSRRIDRFSFSLTSKNGATTKFGLALGRWVASGLYVQG